MTSLTSHSHLNKHQCLILFDLDHYW